MNFQVYLCAFLSIFQSFKFIMSVFIFRASSFIVVINGGFYNENLVFQLCIHIFTSDWHIECLITGLHKYKYGYKMLVPFDAVEL